MEYFGYSTIRPGQKNVVDYIINTLEATDSVQDLISSFPTGYGKSISYLIPVLMLKGMVIVVCVV